MRRCGQNFPKLNLKITKNISLTCYDDLEIAKTNNSPLSLICLHLTNSGERLVGMLMEIFEGLPVVELPEIWQVEIVHSQPTGIYLTNAKWIRHKFLKFLTN